MKYTIKGSRDTGYTVGTNYRRKLTWQPAGMAFVAFIFVVIVVIAALVAFVSPKLFMLSIFVTPFIAVIYGVLHDTIVDFKILPHKKDTFNDSKHFRWAADVDIIEALKHAISYPELQSFFNPDELIEETLTAIELSDSGRLDTSELLNYKEGLLDLAKECENRRYSQKLAGKESHDSSLKDALAVVKGVNKELP